MTTIEDVARRAIDRMSCPRARDRQDGESVRDAQVRVLASEIRAAWDVIVADRVKRSKKHPEACK